MHQETLDAEVRLPPSQILVRRIQNLESIDATELDHYLMECGLKNLSFSRLFFYIKPGIGQIEWCLAPTNLINLNLNHNLHLAVVVEGFRILKLQCYQSY